MSKITPYGPGDPETWGTAKYNDPRSPFYDEEKHIPDPNDDEDSMTKPDRGDDFDEPDDYTAADYKAENEL